VRVLIISANTEKLNMPVLAIGPAIVCAAARQAGHEVTLLDLMSEPEPVGAVHRAVATARPEVIGVSVRNIDDQDMVEPSFLMEKVRPAVEACRASSQAPIVLGGPGYSIFPDAALTYLDADYGLRGDGDEAFPELLQRLARGEDLGGLAGLHVRGGGGATEPRFPPSLDARPEPVPEVLGCEAPTAKLWAPVETRRGCPNGCVYCSTASIQGRVIRTRSPRLVAQELTELTRRGVRQVYFVDNSFNVPEGHALALCRQLQGLRPRVRWRCIIYPRRISEELVRAMAEAGCVEAALGFESGDERVLERLNKHFTPAEVRETSTLLGRYGIRRVGFLLLGGPGETRESVEQSLAFASSLGLEGLRITVGIRIYPETPLARLAVAEGVLAAGDPLLQPRFYLAPGLEPWIYERVTPGFYPGAP
jgi:radical SAM superfamily enzyme YgiQ (UPF0313 family)